MSNNGRFEKGNEIGKETRFKKNHTISSKYKKEYGEMMLEYFTTEERYPTFELFAEKIGVIDWTLRKWCEEHPQFNDCYQRCKNIQKGKLLQGGLEYKYNSTIVKFLAINCHGMKEKLESDNNVTFNVSLSDEIDEESN